MKNIFQIWEENNKKTPFCVSKKNWSDLNTYVIVKEVIPDGKGYGKAFGIPVTNGIVNTYFEYSDKWKKEGLIPNAGTFNWKSRFEKSIEFKNYNNVENQNREEKKVYNLRDRIPFGKYKGKTIEEIYEINVLYLKWVLKNINGFSMSEDVLKLIHHD